MSQWAGILQRYPALGFALYRRYWFASLASVGGWQIANMAMGTSVFLILSTTALQAKVPDELRGRVIVSSTH